MKTEWKDIIQTTPIQAEIFKGLLESQQIPVLLTQEGAGRAIGLTSTPMGIVHLYVPQSQVEAANDILDRYYQGEWEVGPPHSAKSP
jgi:hypothetical protein